MNYRGIDGSISLITAGARSLHVVRVYHACFSRFNVFLIGHEVQSAREHARLLLKKSINDTRSDLALRLAHLAMRTRPFRGETLDEWNITRHSVNRY